jgi:hypothetical protein
LHPSVKPIDGSQAGSMALPDPFSQAVRLPDGQLQASSTAAARAAGSFDRSAYPHASSPRWQKRDAAQSSADQVRSTPGPIVRSARSRNLDSPSRSPNPASTWLRRQNGGLQTPQQGISVATEKQARLHLSSPSSPVMMFSDRSTPQ